jgi:hypothetical protein
VTDTPRKSAAERNAEARAALEPLAPGERTGALTSASLLAATLAAVNIGLALAGVKSRGGTANPTVGAVFSVLMIALAIGMWRANYMAVVAFEMMLGLALAFGFLSLVVASNLLGALLSLVVIAVSGTLFWKLIRTMGRIQAARQPGAGSQP